MASDTLAPSYAETFFDTHCHLDVPAFDADRAAVLARARAVGVQYLLNPAYDLVSSRRAVTLAQTEVGIVAAVGIHPNEAASFDASTLAELRTLASAPGVVAIGEIGLDYHWDTVTHEAQAQAFVAQLALARELNMPVIIHCREAYDDLLALLRTHSAGLAGVLMHAFAGSLEHLRAALALGAHIGIGGPITYPKAHALREVVRAVPLDRLLLETDAPYLAPQSQRGKRNEPAYLVAVAQKVAEVRGLSIHEIAQRTLDNGRRLFKLD
jgi:TatD DNase family protein